MADDDDSLNDYVFGDIRDAIRERARTAGLSFDVAEWSDDEDDPDQYILYIYLPNGDKRRSVIVDHASAETLAATKFESLEALGDYRAVFNKDTDTMEALLQAPSSQSLLTNRIVELPGVEVFEFDSDTQRIVRRIGVLVDVPPREGMSASVQVVRRGGDMTWRLPIPGAPPSTSVEISPPSAEFRAIIGSTPRLARGATLKISGIQYETHDAALALLVFRDSECLRTARKSV